MLVVALAERDAVGVPEAAVERRDLPHRLARSLDREEVENGGGDVERPRVGEEQQARVVDPFGHEARRVLLGVAVGVLEDAVGHPHGQRGREAGGQDNRNARVEGADPERLEAAAARSRDRDPRSVHVVAREQVVDGSHPVPHHVAHEAGAGDRREVAEDRVLAADEVVAAAPARLVPELAALALADGIPAEDDVPAAHEAGRDLLVAGVGLADRRVAAGDEHRRLLPDGSFGHVDEGRHVDAGQALEDELLDPIAVHPDRAGDTGVERRSSLPAARR